LEYIAGAIVDLADVQILDMRVDPMSLEHHLQAFKPDLVGIREGYTVDVNTVREVARGVKDCLPNVPVVVGGHHISLSPQDAFVPSVDAIVIGEGEWRFRELIQNLKRDNRLDTTPDVIFQNSDGIFDDSNVRIVKKNSLKEFDSPMMNERPLPVRHLVDHYREDYFFLYHEGPVSIETARGCIYRCNFCSVHEFHNGEYRVQGQDQTLKQLVELPKNSWVNVVDDLAIQELPAAIKRQYPEGFDPMEQLADQIHEMKLGHRFWMQVRADNVVRNPGKFAKWAKAGLDTVLIGLESFDQQDLDSVSKGTKAGDNVRAIEILHDVGIRIWGGVIIFQQWTARNFDHLKRSVAQYNIEFPQFTIMTPLPGTKLWRDTEQDLITKEPRFFDFLHSVLPTRLSGRKFFEEYASLWRNVGGGLDRARRMLSEVSTTRESVRRFVKQYKTLSAVDTYQHGIELLERSLPRLSSPRSDKQPIQSA
jgi:radical SAM superfamily enzyme YgiQ (UPF0313 family)